VASRDHLFAHSTRLLARMSRYGPLINIRNAHPIGKMLQQMVTEQRFCFSIPQCRSLPWRGRAHGEPGTRGLVDLLQLPLRAFQPVRRPRCAACDACGGCPSVKPRHPAGNQAGNPWRGRG